MVCVVLSPATNQLVAGDMTFRTSKHVGVKWKSNKTTHSAFSWFLYKNESSVQDFINRCGNLNTQAAHTGIYSSRTKLLEGTIETTSLLSVKNCCFVFRWSLCQIYVRVSSIVNKVFCSFPHFLRANAGVLPHSRLWPCVSTFLQFNNHHINWRYTKSDNENIIT
jgi:hypothetical protein